jgi:hypothetical protein
LTGWESSERTSSEQNASVLKLHKTLSQIHVAVRDAFHSDSWHVFLYVISEGYEAVDVALSIMYVHLYYDDL